MNSIKFWVLVSGFCLVACSHVLAESADHPLNVSPVAITPSSATLTIEEISSKWSRSCALCHASGVGGAPRIGVRTDWAPRLAKGKAVLMDHVINGFNDMPPLGYCMSCDRRDFSALIDFMSRELP